MKKLFLITVLITAITTLGFSQEMEDAENPITLIIPVAYDVIRLGDLTIHSPALGFGFLLGEQNTLFTEVERQFMGIALYQPFIFSDTVLPGLPNMFHQIDVLFDGRIKRHQILAIFKSASDKPIAGGLNTIQAGAAWGYELVQNEHVSLILGAAVVVAEMGLPTPVMPMPLIRFNLDTQYFVSKFEFLTGPNLDFTIAPREKIRFTAEMRMDNFRFIEDLNYEFTLWYRLFSADHEMGDFAGIGVGIKNEITGFDLSNKSGRAETFDMQQNSVFAEIDLSLINIQGGWIFDSAYFADDEKIKDAGKGFYASIQATIPIGVD
jgi:hypothetical protein